MIAPGRDLAVTSPSRALELRALGVLELRDGSREQVRAVLQQPKRLALLAYLALGPVRTWHRRDSLLALFWPDLAGEQARASLRRALYFLRRSLGDDVIASRGDDEVGIPAGALWTDVRAFDEAIDRRAHAEALDLYRGPLLEGVFVSGAPEVERWIDDERGRLAERAAGAARRLAEEPGIPPERAVRWARRALEIVPDDEAMLRLLMHQLAQAGDRPAALRAYEEFAARLARDYDASPERETAALAEQLRRVHEGQPGTGPVVLDGPGVVAVLPFAVRAAPALAYLGEGLMDLLSTALDGAGDLRAADPHALLGALDAGTGRLAAAAAVGATLVVDGSIVEAGGRLRAVATLRDAAGRVLDRVKAEAPSEQELFQLVDELSRLVIATRPGRADERLARIAARTSASLAALKAWLRGEHHLRRGEYGEALEAFQEAADADPDFPLAHYRLASAFAAVALHDAAREASARALAQRDRLAPRDRVLLDAQHAWLRGASEEAARRYASAVVSYPDEVEAWQYLGDVLFHSNPYHGKSCVGAREALERALALAPSQASALAKLARLEALSGRLDAFDAASARLLREHPSADVALTMRALRAFLLGGHDQLDTLVDELRSARALALGTAVADVTVLGGRLAAVEPFARQFLDVARSPELRAVAHGVTAAIAAARGRWADAQRELAATRALEPTWGLELHAWLAANPGVPSSAAERAALRAELGAEGPADADHFTLPLLLHNGLHPHLRTWLAGLLAARDGDIEAVAAHEEALNELDVPEHATVLLHRLARSLESEVQRLRGQPAAALAALERARTDVWFQYAVASPFFASAHERFRRAELLAQCGRDAEAAGWLEALAERSPWELPYRAPASLLLASVRARLGDQVGARAALERARADWEDADEVTTARLREFDARG